MNPRARNPRSIYHMNLRVRREPIIFSPINEFFVPDSSKSGLFLLYLSSTDSKRRSIQVNYKGPNKPFTPQTIENQIANERTSTSYRYLEEAVESMKPQLYSSVPIPIVENETVLLIYRLDEQGLPSRLDLSVLNFGRNPTTEPGSRYTIQYSGDYNIRRLSDLKEPPEDYLEHISSYLLQMNRSLKGRYRDERISSENQPKPDNINGEQDENQP